MDELIKEMTSDDLTALLAKYPSNVSIQTLVKGILATRKVEAEAIKVKADFVEAVEALLHPRTFKAGKDTVTTGLPQPPPDIHNLYMIWKEVEIPTGNPEQVEVVKPDGSKVVETRQPTTKAFQWVAEVNKGFTVGKTPAGTSPSKRAITVNKRDGQSLKFMGNFASATKACDYLKLTIGGDSATRVLAREGYILDSYTGTDFTA